MKLLSNMNKIVKSRVYRWECVRQKGMVGSNAQIHFVRTSRPKHLRLPETLHYTHLSVSIC